MQVEAVVAVLGQDEIDIILVDAGVVGLLHQIAHAVDELALEALTIAVAVLARH